MTDDKLSFLDAPPADPIEDKGPAPAAPDAKVDPPAPVIETQPAPVVVPPVAEPKGDAPSVPLPKYLDAYNEARELKKRNQELEEAAKAKVEQPDPLIDPEGYKAAQDRAIDERLWDVRVATSEIAAKRFYGEAVVKSAFDALQAQNDPLLGMRIRRSADPWEEIVKWHKKEQLLAEVGDDPKTYKERIIAEHLASLQQAPAGGPAAAAPIAPAAPIIPPASLTRAPAGPKASDVPVAPGNAFDAAFRR